MTILLIVCSSILEHRISAIQRAIRTLYIPSVILSESTSSNPTQGNGFSDGLKRIFGLDSFREHQLEIMLETVAGRDTVVLIPTGEGKSLCFQLPAACQNAKNGGVTVVVSPLRALIRDQVDVLKAKGVHAVALTSDAGFDRECLPHNSKPALLYITPEKLRKSSFLREVLSGLYRNGNLARFAIDEAHCISTWGPDFRDAYRELGTIRDDFPGVPIMALTAAANPKMIEEIIQGLKLPNPKIFQKSFNRQNLKYTVEPKRTRPIKDVTAFIKSHYLNEKGLIYCTTRKDCTTIADGLQKRGISAKPYHAMLSEQEQSFVHNEWKIGRLSVIVATVAFGMGIDQPNVRFVIHYSLPKSLDNYYQETGRAGRDGLPAECVLYYCFRDLKTIETLPDSSNRTEKELSLLQSRREKAARAVVRYCQEQIVCRRVQLLQHFGEHFEAKDCEQGCDNCAGGTLRSEDFSEEARRMVTLIESFDSIHENLTVKKFTEIFRGDKKQAQFRVKPGYGAGSALTVDIANDIVDRLLYLEVLVEKRIWGETKLKRYFNDYVKVGISCSSKITGL
ncbi:P-loop containing nucleoside triphosphate hydrolase protein [Mycena galopus ATCC 62051]|nr:P-loop containing nucleoside triphosphate hydrolase protein [Mycena galopus ATCC 62051]